ACALHRASRRGPAALSRVRPLFVEGMAFGGMRVLRQLADPQVVIEKYVGAAFLLDLVMPHAGAPADDRLLVAPIRQRQDPSLAGQAPVADVVDEAVDLLQF